MKYKFLILNLIGLLYIQDLNASTSGNCGPKDENDGYTNSCTYVYDPTNKKLTVSGNTMADFKLGQAPWYSLEYTSIVVEEGIKNVGNYAFIYSDAQEVSLPESLTSIGKLAFWDGAIDEVNIPSNVTQIAEGAFNANNISSLQIPTGISKLEREAFSSNPIHELIIPENITEINEYAFYCDGCSSTLSGKAMPLEKIYCSTSMLEACQKAVSHFEHDVEIAEYQKYGDAYYFGGKFYKTANDIYGKNHIKKRIYTIDEANRVAGQKNRVSIKYR